MADEDGSIYEGVVQNTCHIVGEIFDRHARRIARGWRATMPTIVKMDTVPLT
jgi:hypothetical protein